VNILEVFQSFTTQEQAIEHLEKVRWHGSPVCPYCESHSVCRHASGDRAMPRWQCQSCSRAFSVTVGTLFHRTHLPLRIWFLVLALMLNAKKSASACQIARDVGIRRPTVWSMMHRIRSVMANDPRQSELLHGIVEADETYIGGKPRSSNDRAWGPKNTKTGRGTSKAMVAGIVERGGNVRARYFRPTELGKGGLVKFVKQSSSRSIRLEHCS
jgi:transposase-like protein